MPGLQSQRGGRRPQLCPLVGQQSFRADPLPIIPDVPPSYEKEMVTLGNSQGQLRIETAASTQPGACQRTIRWFPSLRGCGAPPAGRPQKPRACSHLRTHKTKTTKDGAPGRAAQLIGVRSLQASLRGRAGTRGVEERIQTCQASYVILGKSFHLEGPRFPRLSDGASHDGTRPEQCERLRASPYPSKPSATSDFNSEARTPNTLWKGGPGC